MMNPNTIKNMNQMNWIMKLNEYDVNLLNKRKNQNLIFRHLEIESIKFPVKRKALDKYSDLINLHNKIIWRESVKLRDLSVENCCKEENNWDLILSYLGQCKRICSLSSVTCLPNLVEQ